MAQFADQTDLHTDSYSSPRPEVTSGPTLNLNKDQKKALGISAAALLLGGTAWAVWSAKKEPDAEQRPTDESPEPNPAPQQMPSDIEVAGKVTDGMSFDEAFAMARQEVGMGGVFNWHGHIYNTFSQDEWSGLSLEQRIEYSQLITGEELAVRPASTKAEPAPVTDELVEKPTVIEGYLDGRRVIGIDDDNDGIIDQLVGEGGDGYNIVVFDATGDQGLDTIYHYDSLDGQWILVENIEHPVVLSNDNFSQGLEESMAREVVDSILEPESPTPEAITTEPATDPEIDSPEDEVNYLADPHESDDDTYINNGDVRDMDE